MPGGKMRLIVKQDGRQVSEFKCAKGPIHIGRHPDSNVFLPDKSVSRHHAVIFITDDKKWMIEDLNSANKTFLNDKEIHKTELPNNCIVRIGCFAIEVALEDASTVQAGSQQPARSRASFDLDDTQTSEAQQLQVIIRRTDFENAPEMRLPAKRAKDFMRSTEMICVAPSQDNMITALLDIAVGQFEAFHAWCALRSTPSGSMSAHGGRQKNGLTLQFSQIKFNDKVTESIEKKQFVLLPRIPAPAREEQKINSAMIGPIIGRDGCYGVLYLDNDLSHDAYNLSDLDYLMLLSIHTAAILKNF
jgi:hypothetical protein